MSPEDGSIDPVSGASDLPRRGVVLSIHIAGSAGEKTTSLPEVRAVAGKGLEGDRYFNEKGTYSVTPGPDREVTFIEEEVLQALRSERGIDLAPEECRRNLVTSGISLAELVGKEFRVGGVTLRGIRICEPCAYLESLTTPGVLQALVHRGGLRAQVLTDGVIRTGDAIWAL